MTITDIIMILAVFFGPILAVQLTRILDDAKDEKERKRDLFKALMATRADSLSLRHVGALNLIDLEFSKGNEKEKEVIEAWKEYHDHLHSANYTPADQFDFGRWNEKRVDLLIELLYKMSKVLNYDFDKVHIKHSSYAPIAHANDEAQKKALIAAAIRVLHGTNSLKMAITSLPQNQQGDQNGQGG